MKKLIYKSAAALSSTAIGGMLMALPTYATIPEEDAAIRAQESLIYGLLSGGAILALVLFILSLVFAAVAVMKTGKKK